MQVRCFPLIFLWPCRRTVYPAALKAVPLCVSVRIRVGLQKGGTVHIYDADRIYDALHGDPVFDLFYQVGTVHSSDMVSYLLRMASHLSAEDQVKVIETWCE